MGSPGKRGRGACPPPVAAPADGEESPAAEDDSAGKSARRWRRPGGGAASAPHEGAAPARESLLAGVPPAVAAECVPPPPVARGAALEAEEGGAAEGLGGAVRGRRAAASGPRGAGPGAGRGAAALLAAGPYNEGARRVYMERYAADLARLAARRDLPPTARWMDSHCHLESILQRSWRGGGKPQVTEHEPLVDVTELVASWPPGLDGCICNCVFRRPSKPGFLGEWAWVERNFHYFESENPVSDKLWFTIGIHPHDAANWDHVAEQMVRRLATHPKCVGIGECGLDFFKHDNSETALQLRAFRAQAQLAVELGKALVVHARLVTAENEALCMNVLRELVPERHPVHIHCYSDSLEHARQLCSGWPNLRIGFTGAITFRDRGKASGKGKGGVEEKKGERHCEELVRGLPLERLLIETDGPYMCPEPFRGQTAHPGHVHRVAERIAEWQARELGDVMVATRKSTTVVYGI